MTRILIGHTGFVGGTLLRQQAFDTTVNSTTFTALRGLSAETVVCAGVSAVKWKANRDPEADWAGIERLWSVLDTMTVEEFVLISTVDVYASPVGADEMTDVDALENHPYGLHRRRLERLVAERFPGARILRLPALFGEGLKKNVIFDLLSGNCLDAINPASRFQWYDLARLSADIEAMRAAGLHLANLVTEPVATSEIMARCFPGVAVGAEAAEAYYDLRTRHGDAFGGPPGSPYVMSREEVLSRIASFVAAARERGCP